jgi:hypothetical protein
VPALHVLDILNTCWESGTYTPRPPQTCSSTATKRFPTKHKTVAHPLVCWVLVMGALLASLFVVGTHYLFLYDCFWLYPNSVEKYIQALTAKTKPKKVLICMIYYPDEALVPGWANLALCALGYNTNPQKLQLMIRKAFAEATSYVVVVLRR